MTTPQCPRCGAPLTVFEDGKIFCSTLRAGAACHYGHDAPRAMVPQPDPQPLTRADIAANMRRLRAEGSAGGSAENYVTFGDEQPAPTPAANAERALVMADPGDDHSCDQMGCPSIGPHYVPAPTPQRTDAGGVAAISDETRHLAVHALAACALSIVDVPRIEEYQKAMAELNAQPAPAPAAQPQHNATSAGVDEGVRGFADTLRAYLAMGSSDGRPERQELRARLAAILATHEIVRRPQ